jgi:succinate dehydrogenase / fumarate reductase flavoprotein subunit
MQEAATFGRIMGKSASAFLDESGYEPIPENHLDNARGKISALTEGKGKERHVNIRTELQENMTKLAGVFRNEKDLKKLKKIVKDLQGRYKNVTIDDKGEAYNLDLFEAFELGNLLSFAEVVVEGAIARKESRGAHFRTDFPKRDDKKWMKHTFAWKTDKGIKLDHTRKAVIYMDRFPPLERKY